MLREAYLMHFYVFVWTNISLKVKTSVKLFNR